MRRTLVLLPLLFAALAAQAQSQESLSEAFEMLEKKALAVHITARVVEDGEQAVWNMELTRFTISGRSVTIRLEGSNVVVVATFTPYRETGDSLLLVAQGQTWITTSEGERVKYRTAFESLPMRLGEPAVFLPLGDKPLDVNLDTERYGVFNIELEINIEPYAASSGQKPSKQ
jgi:hypothetical protein